MALTVESLIASATFESSGLTRGLDVATQALERYDRQAAALTAQPATLSIETGPAERALLGVGEAIPALLRQLDALSRTPLDLGGADQLTQATSQASDALRALEAAVPDALALPGVDPEPLLRGIDAALGALAALERRVVAVEGTPLTLDTTGTRSQLTGLGTAVDQLLARFRGFREVSPTLAADPAPLLAALDAAEQALARFRERAAAPVALAVDAGGLTRDLAALEAGVARSVGDALRLMVEPLNALEAQLQDLAARPLELGLGGDAAADLQRLGATVDQAATRLRALRDAVPPGLALPDVDAAPLLRAVQSGLTALDALDRQLATTGRTSIDLDTSGLRQELTGLGSAVGELLTRLRGTGEAVDLTRPIEQAQRLAGTFQAVADNLPSLALDPAPLAETSAALERVIGLTGRLGELPTLSTREQVVQIQALEAALVEVGPALAGIDVTGVLRTAAGTVRQSLAAVRADLAQPLRVPVPDLAPFTAGLAAGEAALNGFRAKVAVPLPLALARTGDLTRELVNLEQQTAEAVAEAVGLMTLPVDQLEARLKALGTTTVGIDLRAFLSQIAQGEAGVQEFIAAIREGAVEELERLGASADQVAAVLRGFDQATTVTLDTTPAVAAVEQLSGASDTLLQKLGLIRREAATPIELVAAPAPPPPPPPPPPPDFSILARGHEAALHAADQHRLANERLLATMLQQGQTARRVGADNAAAAALMGQLGDRTRGLGQGFDVARIGGSRLTNTLGNVAVGLAGLNGPLASVSSNLLTFFANSAKLVGIGTVILGLKVAYDFLNTAQREVREENDRLVQGLIQQADQALPAAERAQRALVASLQAEREARRDLAQLRSLQVVAPIVLGGTIAQPFIGELARRQAKDAVDAARAVRQAQENAAEAGRDALLRNAQVFSQVIQQGEESNAIRRQAINLVQVLEEAEGRTNVLTEKLAIHQRIVDLQRALNREVEQEIALRQFVEQAQSRRVEDLTAAPALGTDTPASIRQRQAEMARLTEIIHSQTASLKERNEATRQFNSLVIAELAPLQEQLDLLQAQRQTRIGVDTTDAVRQLAALERRIAAVGTATAGQRAQVLRLRAEVDLERVEQQIAPLREALQDAVSLRGLAEAGEVELAQMLGLADAEARVSRLRGSVDRLLATATGPAREVLLEVRTQLAQGDRERLQRQVQEVLAGAEATVRLLVDADPALTEIQRRFAVPFGIELDTTNALAQAEAMAAEVARQIAAATGGGSITAAPAELQQQFTQLTEQIKALMDAPVTALLQGANRVTQQLDAALATAEAQRALLAGPTDTGPGVADLVARTAAVAPLVEQIRVAYERVTAQIDAGVASTTLLVELQQQQAQLAERLAGVQADQRTPFEVTQLAPLEAATRAFVEARDRLDLAIAAGGEAAIAAARAQVATAAALMDQISQRIARIARELGLDAATTRRLLAAITAEYENAGRAAATLTARQEESVAALNETARGIGLAAQAAESFFGQFDEGTARSIRGLQEMAEAAASFIQGDIVGGIFGGLSAIGNILGLGGGPSEHERIVEDNLRRIAENTSVRLDRFPGLGGQADLATTISQLLRDRSFGAAVSLSRFPGGIGLQGQEEVERQLREFGLTLADLERLADLHGLDVLDEKGRLVSEAFEQLRQEIDASIEAQLRFANTLDEQLQALDFRAAFTGADVGLDPLQQQQAGFQREIDAFIKVIGNSGSFIDDALEGLDISDPDAVRAAFLKILEKFEAGTLTAEDLGGLTREDLFRLFGDAAGFLEQFNEATEDATDRLGALNVPTVLRLDALRAAASRPEPPGRELGDVIPVPVGGLPVTPANLDAFADAVFSLSDRSAALGDVAETSQDFLEQIATQTPDDLLAALETLTAAVADRALPEGAASFVRESRERVEIRTETDRARAAVQITYTGDVIFYITTLPGQSPTEFGEAVRRELERHAMNDTGDLTRAGEVIGGGG